MSLRIGMLSFAHYHANFWSEAFAADPRVSLAGVWDEDASRRQTAAVCFAMRQFDDIDGLLASVDAVAICSETARHRSLIEAAARRGRAVLCEKPLAASMDDAVAIETAVRDRGIRFMQSFPKRLDPASIRIRDLIRSGELGEIRLVRIRHGHSHAREAAFTNGWWTRPELSGGGTLIDEGVHALDFLRWLFGNPQTVQANISFPGTLPSRMPRLPCCDGKMGCWPKWQRVGRSPPATTRWKSTDRRRPCCLPESTSRLATCLARAISGLREKMRLAGKPSTSSLVSSLEVSITPWRRHSSTICLM
ncbi:Gfo/Idh/MocA family oxidoreductase [Mesorhizobium sp. M9A.F.Ca.ET.002.03.1.2]|uniref:Gfo/Idh/MocA family protein n=1 Tax=Mesorhizobium sp. M9A.F.Ca.ET.002.03.1.2 TaxID=2493668 RepID=UPI000F760156|nr:Gfo/Idh/MocA family oxidoreductase [Mesorhizobium sp. M9A.F.Ca.ET.002.03.1.2]AZO00854.1 Gfo/Idh/MocA family oxidoreductase [Mesorhizobium sp. M9A.F.Ca.ET.002.03.1.2]